MTQGVVVVASCKSKFCGQRKEDMWSPERPHSKINFSRSALLLRSTPWTLSNRFALSCNTKKDQLRCCSLDLALALQLSWTSLEFLVWLWNNSWFRLSQGIGQQHFAVKLVDLGENSTQAYVRCRHVLFLLLLGRHGLPMAAKDAMGQLWSAAPAAEARVESCDACHCTNAQYAPKEVYLLFEKLNLKRTINEKTLYSSPCQGD